MKKYLNFMAAMLAVFSLTFVSCSSDDDGGNEKSGDKANKDYTFLYNGKTYWYGKYTSSLSQISSNGHWSQSSDGSVLLLLTAYEQSFFNPYEDEYGLTYYEYDGNIECTFQLKEFNPKTAKKGDVLNFYRSARKDTDFDVLNYFWYGEKEQSNNRIRYSWTGDVKGSVKFVSYKEASTGNILTLDFQNLTMTKITTSDYGFQDKSEQATINGEILFIDNSAGVAYDW